MLCTTKKYWSVSARMHWVYTDLPFLAANTNISNIKQQNKQYVDKSKTLCKKSKMKVLHCIALYCIALYCIILYCIVLHCICIALHCIVFYCILLICIALYWIVLYYIVLYCLVFSTFKCVNSTFNF